MRLCAGYIAGRQENGKFYIKLWVEKARLYVEQILKSWKNY